MAHLLEVGDSDVGIVLEGTVLLVGYETAQEVTQLDCLLCPSY